MEKINELDSIVDIVNQCCVCDKYKGKDEYWTNNTPKKERFYICYTYCSASCIALGTGVEMEVANEMYKRMTERQQFQQMAYEARVKSNK